MVGHYSEGMKLVFFTIEMEKGGCHHFTADAVSKQTVPVTGIEILVKLTSPHMLQFCFIAIL